ncbi:YdcF family protein [Aneurinibacillus sp. Ricciae_BoGa-3]|uniref:YdcF family protein n=1 Tax=Aneurinibacillus sp. Ricciae_BoGa-3 TaxID=3022697 RepID=UPI0023415164|nr:YdcF family protein [Aneurinibacillus sp. Ricciae_BoGa-3]WCK55318.1 YdcF family protein [Aneurinibacillus sp. Ricciae_BoGa-3]
MLYVIKFFYTLLFPPGIFIILALFLSMWVYRKAKREAVLLMALTLCLYAVSTPLCGEGLIHSLESAYSPPVKPAGDVLVMLTGGATSDTPSPAGVGHPSSTTAGRILTTAQLYRSLHIPILVSGGKVLPDSGNEARISKQNLMSLGIPDNQIILDDTSLNTTENAQHTQSIMKKYGFKNPIVITSAFHMKRAVKNFQKLNVPITPYPTDYITSRHAAFSAAKTEPSSGGLYLTAMACKEYLGMLALSL